MDFCRSKPWQTASSTVCATPDRRRIARVSPGHAIDRRRSARLGRRGQGHGLAVDGDRDRPGHVDTIWHSDRARGRAQITRASVAAGWMPFRGLNADLVGTIRRHRGREFGATSAPPSDQLESAVVGPGRGRSCRRHTHGVGGNLLAGRQHDLGLVASCAGRQEHAQAQGCARDQSLPSHLAMVCAAG